MFDKVRITVNSGKGGDGAVSFRREKFVPFGGPDGGDGGHGGDVVVRAEAAVDSLIEFNYKRRFRAANGKPGGKNKKHGGKGSDMILRVPLGTVVSSEYGGDVEVVDLVAPGQYFTVARGGKGGWGNARFATPTNQAPRLAQKGEAGEEKEITLEMRLIADVGIIGYPSVGKSTLLAAASAARPEIASYPFTTRSPVLGVVEVGIKTFILAEIPGLIAGAHRGRGLGHEFLRHVSRTRLLIHLLQGTSASPLLDMEAVNSELALYDAGLARKRQLVAVNKVDLPEVREKMSGIKQEFAAAGIKAFFISAETGEGVPRLMAAALEMLESGGEQQAVPSASKKVFRPQPKNARIAVRKEGAVFIVSSPALERIVARTDETGSPAYWQLKPYLERLGIYRALVKAGVKPGDRVRCGNLDWVWE